MRGARSALLSLLGAALALTACGGPQTGPAYHAETDPAALSEWGMLRVSGERLELAEGVLPYDLNTALFSDYALKLRTVWMPEGAAAQYRANAVFDFPVGTVITKTFYYPRIPGEDGAVALEHASMAGFDGTGLNLTAFRLVETRILVRRHAGWTALPYIWNDEQTEAVLRRAGDLLPLSLIDEAGEARALAYLIPNSNQCAACHLTDAAAGGIQPIGPAARHLNRDFAYAWGASDQLGEWTRHGFLEGAPAAGEAPRAAVWPGGDAPLAEQARAYLDINCAHCHNPAGPARTSGLFLEHDQDDPIRLGVCKTPIAAGAGTGGRRFSIVPGEPDASITIFRMESEHPAIMMPELGRSVAHEEGVELIRLWITAMDGGCG